LGNLEKETIIFSRVLGVPIAVLSTTFAEREVKDLSCKFVPGYDIPVGYTGDN
jgi:hypothetical protein